VFLVEHIKTNQKYAIKYVDSRKYGLASHIDMVFKEAELLKNLNHKNIVQITNFFALKDMRVVFLMEYLEGGELGVHLKKKGRLDELEALDIFLQLLDAVEFCHLNNIIHRDLKLENILFTSKGGSRIKVVDFGIAGFYSGMEESESNAGSLKYMAPEILTGANNAANPAIDVWSMGVILYALLSGHLPFTGSTRHEVKSKIIAGTYQIDSDVRKRCSMECVDMLTRMLTVNTKVRITTAEMKKHPWISGGKLPTAPSWIEEEMVAQAPEKRRSIIMNKPFQKVTKNLVICASADQTPKEVLFEIKEKNIISRVTSLRANSLPKDVLASKVGFRLLNKSQNKKELHTASSIELKKKEPIPELKKRETPIETKRKELPVQGDFKRKDVFGDRRKEDRIGVTPDKIRIPEISSLGSIRSGTKKITLPSIKNASSFLSKMQLSARGSEHH